MVPHVRNIFYFRPEHFLGKIEQKRERQEILEQAHLRQLNFVFFCKTRKSALSQVVKFFYSHRWIPNKLSRNIVKFDLRCRSRSRSSWKTAETRQRLSRLISNSLKPSTTLIRKYYRKLLEFTVSFVTIIFLYLGGRVIARKMFLYVTTTPVHSVSHSDKRMEVF